MIMAGPSGGAPGAGVCDRFGRPGVGGTV